MGTPSPSSLAPAASWGTHGATGRVAARRGGAVSHRSCVDTPKCQPSPAHARNAAVRRVWCNPSDKSVSSVGA